MILKSARDIFLEVGYQEASMRKIAARAGITAGAIYKYFSGKEEMFGEIFAESGKKLMEITRSMMGVDFTAMTDEELVNVLYSRVSVQTFNLLEGDMKLFHMLLKNDSGKCIEQFQDIYIERGAAFAMNYYGELYRRGIACKKLSAKTVYMLTRSEFSMVCEMIAEVHRELLRGAGGPGGCRDALRRDAGGRYSGRTAGTGPLVLLLRQLSEPRSL